MTKIRINKNIFEANLLKMQNSINKKSMLEHTSNINLELIKKNNGYYVLIRSTDLIIYHDIEFLAEDVDIGEQEFKFSINGETLIKAITNSFDSGDLTLILEKNKLRIEQKKFNIEFQISDIYKFENQSFEIRKLNIDSSIFIKSLQTVLHACGKKETAIQSMQNVLIDIKKDNYRMVATDAKRIAVLKIDIVSEEEMELLIPYKSVADIVNLFQKEVFHISVKKDSSNKPIFLLIETDKQKFNTALTPLNYVSYESIVYGIKWNKVANVRKSDFSNALDKFRSLTKHIKINFSNTKNSIESIDGFNGSYANLDFEVENIFKESIIRVEVGFLLDSIKYAHCFDDSKDNEKNIIEIFCGEEEGDAFLIKNGDYETIRMSYKEVMVQLSI